jgi:tetratricopeptide (TPR) repeat protein
MSDEAEAARTDEKDVTKDDPKDSPGPDTLDLLRGEVSDEDLAELEGALDAIDFAARKSSPERLAKLRASHARLADLIDQIEKGSRKRAADRPPVSADDEAKVKALVDEAVGHGEAGRLEEALDRLLAALRIDPQSLDVLFNLGVVYGKLANLASGQSGIYASRNVDDAWAEKAMSAYGRLLEIDSENVYALNNLATLHELQGETDLAIELLQRSLAIQANQVEVKQHLEELKAP